MDSLTPLNQALASLDRALEQPKNEFTRDSVTKRFQYSYELSWKTLKRYFSENNNLEEHNVKNIWREAGKQGFVDDVELWFEFHFARNKTSHMYSEKVAESVYDTAVKFQPAAKKLFEKLEAVIGS